MTTTASFPSGVYLGFDYGERQTGVAVGQTLILSARPIATVAMHAQLPRDWIDLDQLIRQWQPVGFIVGLALNADGSASKTSQHSQRFAQQLVERYACPCYFVDEHLTTVMAKELWQAQRLLGRHKSFDKVTRDGLSAQVILEAWFSTHQDAFV